MAGIKRFITYIYAYENGKKGKNVGFAKAEIRGTECRLEVHLRKTVLSAGICTIYLFMESEEKMLSFPVGEMKMTNGNGDFGTIIKADKIGGSEYTFSQMEGLVFTDGTQVVYMTRWTEGKPIYPAAKNMKLWQPVRFDAESKKEPEVVFDSPIKEEVILEEELEAENIQATEMPAHQVFPKICWEEIWEQITQTYPVFEIAGETPAVCARIELKELRQLPRKEWYLANNSFLLHGFFNYHYLVIGKFEQGAWFLGIPGFYQQQECVMAAIFGFPGFLAADGNFNAQQMQHVQRFGYWYHLFQDLSVGN